MEERQCPATALKALSALGRSEFNPQYLLLSVNKLQCTQEALAHYRLHTPIASRARQGTRKSPSIPGRI